MILNVTELDAGLMSLRVNRKDEMNSLKNPSDFTVVELKERLKIFGLSTCSDRHNDLISRLMEADPESGWLRESGLRTGEQNDLSQNEEMEARGSESRSTLKVPRVSEAGMLREIDIIRREKELLERELALARRKAKFLRERERERERFETAERRMDRAEVRREAIPAETIKTTVRPSITAIAELLAHFDGVSDSWEVWKKQVRLLASTYHLRDKMVRILIGARLKGKAAEWFRSKSEQLEDDDERSPGGNESHV